MKKGMMLAGLVLALTVVARGERFRESFDIILPGVDLDGNCAFSNTGDLSGPGTAKAVVNTRTGKVRARVKGQVLNESGLPFRSKDVVELNDCIQDVLNQIGLNFIDLLRVRYRVKVNGNARGLALGVMQEPQ
jgi:hypothetical protein